MNSKFYISLSRGFRKLAESDCQLCDVCPFAWNNLFPTGRIFIKFGIWWFKKNSFEEIQVSLKIWQEMWILHMKNCVQLWKYGTELVLEWHAFQTKWWRKENTHFVFSKFPPTPRKCCRLWDNVEKYGRARQVTDDSIIWCRKDAIIHS